MRHKDESVCDVWILVVEKRERQRERESERVRERERERERDKGMERCEIWEERRDSVCVRER